MVQRCVVIAGLELHRCRNGGEKISVRISSRILERGCLYLLRLFFRHQLTLRHRYDAVGSIGILSYVTGGHLSRYEGITKDTIE